MSPTAAGIAHRLFERTLWSARPLRLLAPADQDSAPAPGDVHLQWCDEPLDIEPDAELVAGRRGDFCTRRSGSALIVDRPACGIRVRCDLGGINLVLHPLPAPQSAPSGTRQAADGLVTRVLCRLPSLWGQVPLHAAALGTPRGVVLVTGVSGAGKSTVSQYLVRDHGWQLLDDDTSALDPRSPLRVQPMRARSRLHAQAAVELGLAGESLPAYAGRKVALPGTALDPAPPGVAAVVHLIRVPAAQAPPGPPRASRISGPQALLRASAAAMPLEPRSHQWLANRLAASAQLAVAPTATLTSAKEAVTAREVAAGVAAFAAAEWSAT